MNKKELENFFEEQKEKAIYTSSELKVLLKKKSQEAFRFALYSMVKSGLLIRLCKGVFAYKRHKAKPERLLGQMVSAIRQGEFSYLSLESVLSEAGIISQVSFVKTFMTTGRSGLFKTPLGVIEFTHTKRTNFIKDVVWNGNYWQATPEKAHRDLKRVGRDSHLMEWSDGI